MRAMGFEPMQLSLRELESRSLDHSDTRAWSSQRRLELAATRPKSNGGATLPGWVAREQKLQNKCLMYVTKKFNDEVGWRERERERGGKEPLPSSPWGLDASARG